MTFLLAGGRSDPNLTALANFAERLGISLIDLRGEPDSLPILEFNPELSELRAPDLIKSPNAAFVRPDVFSRFKATQKKMESMALLTVIRAWLAAQDQTVMLNYDPFGRSKSVNKGAALAAASRAGFSVPETRFGNSRCHLEEWTSEGAVLIQKPVDGGDYCRPLKHEALAKCLAIPPIIAQTQIEGPDLRVFRVGDSFLSFELNSKKLDYRNDQEVDLKYVDTPDEIVQPLTTLTDQMGLNWSASDFKVCPARGPVYLETNANPMFVAFDQASNGDLVRAMFVALQLLEVEHTSEKPRPEQT